MRNNWTALCLAAAGLCTFTGISSGATIIGSVAYNSGTNLYTYSYTLNNTAGSGTIRELSVLIDSAVIDTTLNPVAHTEPPGSSFNVSFSGGIANPPYNEFGTFWAWQTLVPVGTSLSGFSFTTTVGPTAGIANNYFTFGGPVGSGDILEYGHVIAPDFAAPVSTPEPSTAAFILIGIVLLTGSSKRLLRQPARID